MTEIEGDKIGYIKTEIVATLNISLYELIS